MKRLGFLLIPSFVVLVAIGLVFWSDSATAVVSNADYSGMPPFISTIVTPNVLIMLDNSGSMGYRAVCDNTTNQFFALTSIRKGGSGNLTATVTYASQHGFTAADVGVTQITISGVTTTIASNANYNGTFTIASVPSATTLTYQMAAQPGTTPAPGNPQLVIAGPPGNPRVGLPAPNVYGQCPTSTALYPAGTPDGAPFRETVTFSGNFDLLSCYTYDSTNTRFDPSSTKATISSACSSTEWDGNFLNWATFRRQDALKKALIGGQCVVARAADGTCPASGSPAKITIKGADGALSFCCANEATAPIALGAGPNRANGRVPTAIQTLVSAAAGSPTSLVLHLMASTAMTSGGFCVGASNVAEPSSGATACGIVGAATPPTTGEFMIQVSAATEPTGVIQDLGDKARFGLIEFRNSGDGGKVLVPIGSTQGIPYNSTTITTYTSNKAAMLGQIQSTFAATGTPLSETLYTGIRYIAQLPQPFGATTTFLYPCAFSACGPAFGSSQTAGGLGTGESVSLVSGETCPSGYQGSSFSNCTAGRDPYFFSSANPVWASSSKVVPCCKTFIMFLTDGEPNIDDNTELDRFIYPSTTATAIHGTTCTGDYTGTPASLTGSAADQAAYVAQSGCFDTVSVDPTNAGAANTIAPATLLKKHKTDYPFSTRNHYLDEIAYWGHTTDLRQATVTYPNGATETGHDLTGFQNVTIYPVFAFGNISGREILMQAGKNGGFIDQNGNNVPDLQSEWDQVDNVTGLLVPDGVPDTYFESQNANDMKDKMLAALVSMLQKTSSGTSVSVLATSSTGDGAIYQAYFFPVTFVNIASNTNQVLWTGFTQGLFLDKFGNLREDYSAPGCAGPPDGKLVLIHDCIIKVRLETDPSSPNFNSVVVDRFKDDGTAPGSTAGDGVADTTTPFQTVALSTGGVSNVQPLWEGGRRLALLSPGTTCESSTTWPIAGNMSQGGNTCRRILTWADVSNGGGIGGGAGNETLEFSTANAFTLCPFLGGKAVLYCNGDNVAAITPADISTDPNLAGCLGITRRQCAQNEATSIITWSRGSAVSGLRDRTFNVVNDAGAIVQAQWKLGDVINSSPVIVGAPRERYDVLYGDATYAQFFQRYKDRRQVAYMGANDGMLHAFNAGFFKTDESPIDGTGPTVQVRFTTTPKQLHGSTDCAGLPCDAAVTQYAFRTDAPLLGAELWAFIPQDLLPQLRWLTVPNYDHAYYVDLTPKVTDARIFTADADHPGGWGTILIGGFRLGGSCTNCTSGKGTPRVVQADFNYNGTTTDTGNGTSGSDYRVFLSSYFVMDITNPEKEPRLLWVFRDKDLGLTTAKPAVLRVNPSTDAKTSSTNEKWYVVFGTGPTHHDAFSTQTAQMFVVDLKQGPAYADINKTSGTSGSTSCSTTNPCIATNKSAASGQLRAYSTGVTGAFMADAVTLDFELDFRTDVIYAGSAICNGSTTSTGCTGTGPVWRGAMWRLTTNGGSTNPDNWGVVAGGIPSCAAGGLRCPSSLISTFAYTSPQATTCPSPSPCNVGPITTAPALTQDDTQNTWLFFGSGRYYSTGDKSNVDTQHFFGVKDCIINGSCTNQGVERNNLFNSSNVVTCTSCASGSNVSTTGSTSSFTIGFSSGGGNLVNNIQNMDGWFTTFNDPTKGLLPSPPAGCPPTCLTTGERNVSSATLLGGSVFFTTFVPSTDICQATGTGQLYAVYYLTGGPYTASAVGAVPSGTNVLASKAISLGQGLPSQMAVQIGAQGSGTSGSASSAGCTGRITGFIQASTGVLGQICGTSAGSVWSHLISWRDL